MGNSPSSLVASHYEKSMEAYELKRRELELSMEFKEKEMRINSEFKEKEMKANADFKNEELKVHLESKREEMNIEMVKMRANYMLSIKQVEARLREIAIVKKYDLACKYLEFVAKLTTAYDVDNKIERYLGYLTEENKSKNPAQYKIAEKRCEKLADYDLKSLLNTERDEYNKMVKEHGEDFERQMAELISSKDNLPAIKC
jgi:hypothetical protein